jgi:hypothetical protein
MYIFSSRALILLMIIYGEVFMKKRNHRLLKVYANVGSSLEKILLNMDLKYKVITLNSNPTFNY